MIVCGRCSVRAGIAMRPLYGSGYSGFGIAGRKRDMMIHVIASISVKPAFVKEFLTIFKENVPAVLAEDGCMMYVPAIDVNTGLPPQVLAPAEVTIIEQWESVEALHAHLATPHMLEYKDKVKEMVADVSIKVLTEA